MTNAVRFINLIYFGGENVVADKSLGIIIITQITWKDAREPTATLVASGMWRVVSGYTIAQAQAQANEIQKS